MTGSYNVQDCDVSSDQHTSSILVECTFAINSTAPGIVVIQDDQSQYTINKTLQRLLQDSDKGSVNITGLPAGEYSVRVYDNSPATDSTSAAYQYYQLIHIIPVFTTGSSISSNTSGTKLISICTIPSCTIVSGTPVHSHENIIILASSIITGLMLLLVVIVATSLCVAVIMCRKRNKGIC